MSQPLGAPASRPVSQSRFSGAEIAAMLPKRGRVRNVAARADRTYKSVVYDSKSEALHAFKLDAQKASGTILDWKRQIRFDLIVNGVRICKFMIDFQIFEPNGHIYFEEVKGWPTPEFKLKLKLFKALNPDIDYRITKA